MLGRTERKRCEIKNKDNPKPLTDQPRRADIDSPSASAAMAAQKSQHGLSRKARLGSGLQIHLPPNCCTHKTSPSLHPPTCCDHSLSAIIWSPKCHCMYQDRIEFLIEPGQMEVIKALQIKSIPHLHEKATHDATKKCACSIQINTMETIESKMRHSIRFIFLLAEPIVTSNECAD